MSELSTIESIFHAALAKATPEERAAFLADACGGDVALRRQVDELLQAQEKAGPFLEQPAAATVTYIPAEGPGTRLGPYKLLQQIGEGGMGIVYMAEQEQPVRRRVALKVIKPGMDSAQVIARFQAERQALAMMDHQNIARVFDAGTTDAGRPYFVMELVHGVPITKYCDDAKLTPRQRLDLFVPVCRAIQHAHQKGILHRDIKPSNVLVCLYDGQPVAKVIDFGVAKAMEQPLTERTMFTQFGQVIGTLEYMSPEQAEMSQLGVDTRSDVYSLGVVLYELLTGSTPLQRKRLRDAAMAEILRMIREEEPPPPSTRLSTSEESLVNIAQQRHTDPAQLTRLVRGELDWIVMKSIEKDRTRRYESAGSLASDLERFLKDEPVDACPPSATYLLRKYANKHRVLLATTAAFLSLLIVGTAISVWLAVRATEAERLGLESADVAKQALKVTQEAQKGALRSLDLAKKAKDDLDRSHETLRRSLYASDMNLVRTAWDGDNVRRALDLLERHKPKPGETDLRGFEWFYWKRQCRQEIKAVQLDGFKVGSIADIETLGRSLIISPSGRFCAATTHKESKCLLTVWNTATGQRACEVAMPLPKNSETTRIEFNPGESLVLVASFNPIEGTLTYRPGSDPRVIRHVIDIASAKVLYSFPEADWHFHRDGKHLITVQQAEKTIVRWRDVSSGQELRAASAPLVGPYSVSDDQSGAKIALLHEKDGTQVRVFNAETGAPIIAIDVPANVRSWRLMWHPDGRRLVCQGQALDSDPKQNARFHACWDSVTGELQWKQRQNLAEKDDGSSVFGYSGIRWGRNQFGMFSADGKRLLFAVASFFGRDRMFMLNADTGKKLIDAMPFEFRYGAPAFSSDGGLLYTFGGWPAVVQVWGGRSGDKIADVKVPAMMLLGCRFDSTGDHLLTLDIEGTIRFWNTAEWKRLAERSPTKRVGYSVLPVLSPDGRVIAQVQSDKSGSRLDILDSATGKPLRSFGELPGSLNSPVFIANGNRVAAILQSGEDAEIVVFDLTKGQRRTIWKTPNDAKRRFRHSATIPYSNGKLGIVAISTSREVVFKGKSGKDFEYDTAEVRLFDLELEKEIKTLAPSDKRQMSDLERAFVINADGTLVAERLDVGPVSLVIRKVASGAILHEIAADEFRTMSVEFSPDGRRFLMLGTRAGWQLTAQIRDIETGKVLATLENIDSQPRFSPDGGRLVGIAANRDTKRERFTATVWDTQDGRQLSSFFLMGSSGLPRFTPDGQRLIALRDGWEERFPDDALLIIDGTPFPEDLLRLAAEKK